MKVETRKRQHYEETVYFPEKEGNKVFAVDTYVTLCKCIKVEAEDKFEALEKVNTMMEEILRGSAAEVAARLGEEGFEDCEELSTTVSGVANADGEIEYC